MFQSIEDIGFLPNGANQDKIELVNHCPILRTMLEIIVAELNYSP